MHIKIKEVRKEFGDTLQSLAHKINYDYSNLSKVERGIYTPSLDLLDKIAKVYNIDITDLLDQPNLNNKKKVPLEKQCISEKYLLSLDGKQISQSELEFLIQSIRAFRHTLKNYKEKNDN